MIFRFFSNIPIFGDVLRILNSYAYHGDSLAERRFANVFHWITAFGIEILISITATFFCMPELANKWLPLNFNLNYSVALQPGTLATSILPNLLGFGIGIYALIFGLNKMLLRELQNGYVKDAKNKGGSLGSVLVLNAEMAVPLLILAMAIIFGVIQQIFNGFVEIEFIAWFLFWLSLIYIIELINTLYGLGENVILKSVSS